MKILIADESSNERCENCRYFYQHYVKVPFIAEDYVETDDGYCIRALKNIVRTFQVCARFEMKTEENDLTLPGTGPTGG